MDRSPRLQQFLDDYAEEHGISQAVVEGSDHAYSCRCRVCLEWWATVGPQEDVEWEPQWGPFSREEIEGFLEEKDGEAN